MEPTIDAENAGIPIVEEFLAPPPPPDIVTFAELAIDSQVILAKESADKAILESIGLQSAQGLKPKLVEWFMKGCPNAYPILSVSVQPPEICSDGESRNITDYIAFCSGGTIQDHVAVLNAKLLDIYVSFSYDGTNISIVVSKMG